MEDVTKFTKAVEIDSFKLCNMNSKYILIT